MNRKKVAVIGSGVSGLSAAAVLASQGHGVTVFEKNKTLGGRLRQFSEQGFVFDMGPSWYWMPDVFDRYFSLFGCKSTDFYELVKLDPGFQVVYDNNETLKVPANWDALLELFENQEKGAAEKLKQFMKEAEYKYNVGINNLVYKPGLSFTELITPETITGVFRLQLFSSFKKHIRSYFKNPRLISLMEFPILFLGAMPENTPALYSLMNYAGLKQGTYYPMGGFGKVVDAMVNVAKNKGVEFVTDEAIETVSKINNDSLSVISSKRAVAVDGVIAAADYHHIESNLLKASNRNYTESYWSEKTFAPSCLLFYIGVNKKIKKLEHHNLFFDSDFDLHSKEIYNTPQWPTDPMFYVCCPSKTDASVAPVGMENLFVLMPVATGLTDTELIRQKFFDVLMSRIEKFCGESIKEDIVFLRSYCINDFITDYNSYKGNAYGLANTLKQTANLKPKIKNKHLPNFYYAGQLTVPGPGVPPAIISGQVAANELNKQLNVKL